MKRVLVVTFSQTGQLADIVGRVVGPLRAGGHAVHVETLQPRTPFPFPWPVVDFVDVFPECVQLDPPPLQPMRLNGDEDFDLVVLAYQVWFLAPALPMTAFLQSPAGQALLRGKPVVTLVACRNMWLSAQQTMSRLIAAAGGRLVDHVALVDRGPALATFITTPRWVLTGRRDGFLGLPPAGVAPAEIAAADRFGKALAEALDADIEKSGLPMLAGLGAVTVNPRLALSERAGLRAFRLWSRLIRAFGRRGQRRRWPILALFAVYLILMVLTVVPLSLLLQTLLAPLLARRLARLKAEHEQPSGCGCERMNRYVS